jgi:hypothetical protein
MNETKVTIATTLAPAKELDLQRSAVTSWLDLGFEVTAVNTPEEIAALAPFFPGVKFVPATRNASEKFGRPYIYFDDLLAALAATDSKVCGIVNSDIHFTVDNLSWFISNEAQGSFVFGARMDIPSLDTFNAGTWYEGFDYFFFDRKLLSIYPPAEFCIGLPWWDYWVVVVPLASGVAVKQICSPLAYHVVHPTGYSTDSWLELGYVLAKYFTPNFPLNSDTMGVYNRLMFELINTNQAIQNIALIPEQK